MTSGPPDPDTLDIDTGFVDVNVRDAFHARMVHYGVRAVFCGHNHIFRHQPKDGVGYFISGSGAPVAFTVDGGKFSTQTLQPEHLDVAYPDGENAPSGPLQRVWATNTNDMTVTMNHILLHVHVLL